MELVRTEKLSLNFGGVIVADDIDFSLEEGERLAVIGANGARKTTFINICTGFLKPKSGKIFFAEQEITDFQPSQIVHLALGRSFQLAKLFIEHTVRPAFALS